MSFIIWLIMFLIFIYSIILFVHLWKKEEKAGAFSVLVLTFVTIAAPFFSLIK